jgi:hypothetical protein
VAVSAARPAAALPREEEAVADQKDAPACANCGEPATVKTDGISADVKTFCDKCKPDSATGLSPV